MTKAIGKKASSKRAAATAKGSKDDKVKSAKLAAATTARNGNAEAISGDSKRTTAGQGRNMSAANASGTTVNPRAKRLQRKKTTCCATPTAARSDSVTDRRLIAGEYVNRSVGIGSESMVFFLPFNFYLYAMDLIPNFFQFLVLM